MRKEEIKKFFQDIQKLNLSKEEKDRMLKLFQVRGSNNRNKVMSYQEFIKYVSLKKGRIKKLVLGPKWSRLVFVDIDVEV